MIDFDNYFTKENEMEFKVACMWFDTVPNKPSFGFLIMEDKETKKRRCIVGFAEKNKAESEERILKNGAEINVSEISLLIKRGF